jgi:hypothetical protein
MAMLALIAFRVFNVEVEESIYNVVRYRAPSRDRAVLARPAAIRAAIIAFVLLGNPASSRSTVRGRAQLLRRR